MIRETNVFLSWALRGHDLRRGGATDDKTSSARSAASAQAMPGEKTAVDCPRIPTRPDTDAMFAALLRRPEGRAAAQRWWERVLSSWWPTNAP